MVAKNNNNNKVAVERTPEEEEKRVDVRAKAKARADERKKELENMSYEELLQQATYKPVSTSAITKCAAIVGIPRMSQQAKVYLTLRGQKYLESLIKLSMVDALNKGMLMLKEENALEAYDAIKDTF